FFFFQAEDGIRDRNVTGVQTCALPIFEVEVTQQLKRLRRHVCIAVYCGNSEVEQQAAMLGMPRELWRGPLFSTLLPELCRRWHPRIPYVPSTPSGGAMPFHVGTGLTHYFGVGAYLRPVAQ